MYNIIALLDKDTIGYNITNCSAKSGNILSGGKKMKVSFSLLCSLAMFAVTLSCSTPSRPVENLAVPESAPSQPQTTVREPWEMEWNKILLGSKKAGRLFIVSTVGSEIREAMTREFKAKYGISPDIVTGRGAEVSARLLAERKSGLYTADVYVGGAGTLVTRLKPGGALDLLEPAFVLPEVRDPKVWWQGAPDWIDKQHYILAFIAQPKLPVTINTEIIKPNEIQSYRDLLDPRWKGKMSMNDPTETGAGGQWIGVVGQQIMGLDFIKEFVRQEPVILRDQRVQMEWIAKGKYPIALYAKTDLVPEFVKVGTPLKNLNLKEGTFMNSASGNLALINKGPNPHAARLFINWLLSKEGQTIFARAQGAQSTRIDVTTEFLDPEQLRVPGMKYYDGNSEEYNSKRLEQLKIAEEIFGPLMK